MATTNYSFEANVAITAYQIALILQEAKLQISQAQYDTLPPEIKVYFVPVTSGS